MLENHALVGCTSPHVVIRGETLPRIETLAKPVPVAHNDWLAFTFTPPPEAAKSPVPWLLPQLREIFGLPEFTAKSTGKGWNGYSNRVELGDNSHYGLIAFGGEKQRGTVHVELNACVCALVSDWHTVQQWGESLGAKITRVDLAHDDFAGQTINIEIAKQLYADGGFTSSGRPPKAKLYDDMGSGEGKTLYIGNRANGKLCRVYEKGKQLGGRSSPWVRVEVELRGKKRVIPWDALTSPEKYLAGAFPCLAYLSQEQHKIRTITKAVEITIESITEHLRTVGGKSFNVLRQVYGGDDTALLNQITRDGIPRRLVNYSDFLPRVLDGKGVLP
jgi:DNA relaxase NicK